MNTEPTTEADPALRDRSRRRLLEGATIGGAAVVGAVVGATAGAAGASSFDTTNLEFEVACVGDTWREGLSANPADDGDFRAPFSVEGWMYPAGTILGDGFVPSVDGSIGKWFCRGYVLVDSTRSEPHTHSHQDYFFAEVTEQDPFPASMLSSAGLEGTGRRDLKNTRAVIGGTGDYLGATGAVTQEYIADNTTLFAGQDELAPCFRFVFDLRLLS